MDWKINLFFLEENVISFHICQLALSMVCFQLSFLHNHCEMNEKAEGYSDNKSLCWNKENIMPSNAVKC